MKINKLILTNFKNYESETIEFSPKLNCIVGLNGMGKTNILDAIYYLCMCKSHLSGTDRSNILHQASFARVEGHFTNEDKVEKIVVKLQPNKPKVVEKNGVAYQKLSDHVGVLPVVMIHPFDIALVFEGSEVRRRFIDNTLSQLDATYLKQLIVYNRILKQRNSVLKQWGISGKKDNSLLDVLDHQIEPYAQHIFAIRANFAKRFLPLFQTFYSRLSGDKEIVNISYHSKLQGESLAKLLQEVREKDWVLQRSTVGIHKDDLKFEMNGRSLKNYASQGQLKSFLLALKLAQYELLRQEKATSPILLLDDIFDKLDRHRVSNLLLLLLEFKFGQICITDTHEHRVEEIIRSLHSEYKKIVITEGKVSE